MTSRYVVYKKHYIDHEIKTVKAVAEMYQVTTVQVVLALEKYYRTEHHADIHDYEYYVVRDGIPQPAYPFHHAKEAMDLYLNEFKGEFAI